MKKYIDADALCELVVITINNKPVVPYWTIKEMKGENVAPVIHAHWRPSKEPKHEKEFSRFFVCTNCSHDIQLRHAGIVEDIGFEYCPHCGAKMDEVTK